MNEKEIVTSFSSGIGYGAVSWALGVALNAIMEVLLAFGAIGLLIFVIMTIVSIIDGVNEIQTIIGYGVPFIVGFLMISILIIGST